ncbi:hypothetical protein [Burkholderia gladioli]
MTKNQFPEERMVTIQRDAKKELLADVAKKQGIIEQMIYDPK